MTIPNGATILADEASGDAIMSCRAKLWRDADGSFAIHVERKSDEGRCTAAKVIGAPSLVALDQRLLFEITSNQHAAPCPALLRSAAAAMDAACIAAA